MKAVILCPGEGNRLRPITCSIPRAMLPIMGRPIVEHSARLLHRHGINEIIISGNYLSEQIKKHFSQVEIPDMKVDVKGIQNLNDFFLDDDVILISDNIVTDVDFSIALSEFEKNGCLLALTKPDGNACEYGSIFTDSSGVVTKYVRCPDPVHSSGNSFMGIILVPKGTKVGECTDLQTLMEKLVPSFKVTSLSPLCYIKSISDFESYHKCCRDFMDKKINLPFPCDERAPSVWVDENKSCKNSYYRKYSSPYAV